jgi:hypothetical protein
MEGVAELLDGSAWTTEMGSLTSEHNSPATVVSPSGHALVIGGWRTGGYSVGTIDAFDPTTATWAYAGSLRQARRSPMAAALDAERTLVLGGMPIGWTTSRATEVFDRIEGKSFLTASPRARGDALVFVTLANGELLLCGGLEGELPRPDAERFDPSIGRWRSAGVMRTPRHGHSATLLSTGQVLVVGGTGPAGALATTELFDPDTDTWIPSAELAQPRSHHAALLLADGRVMVAGGFASEDQPRATVELLGPAAPCGRAEACGCVPEDDTSLCRLRLAECGSASLVDSCGNSRTVSCGDCPFYGQSCGALGVANRCGVTAPSPWRIETLIESGSAGGGMGFGLDADGEPVIAAFYRSSSETSLDEDLLLWEHAADGWRHSVLELAEGTTWNNIGLGFDSSGEPVVSFIDQLTDEIRLSRRTSGIFEQQRLDTYPQPLFQLLEVGPDGVPRVCFTGQWSADYWLYCGKVGESGLSATQVDSTDVRLTEPTLVVDATGAIHVAYFDYDATNLRYARQGESGWATEVVDAGPEVGSTAALAVDGDVVPHLVYWDYGDDQMVYARRSASGWTREPIEGVSSTSRPTLALDADGQPHAAWTLVSGESSTLRYARRTSSGWQVETVDADGAAEPVMVIAPDGGVHLAYYTRVGIYDLRHAWRG